MKSVLFEIESYNFKALSLKSMPFILPPSSFILALQSC